MDYKIDGQWVVISDVLRTEGTVLVVDVHGNVRTHSDTAVFETTS